MIGTSIARYDILEELGQGGMSVVYLARDTALNRKVAVKVLHEHLARKPENRKRFRREAEAIARLQHPNILDVYDVSDESDERSFIVMEYIPGMNLRQFIDRHERPPPEAAAFIGVDLCNALSHAHRHGVIHRDLKPENVMVTRDGRVKLMDFGIAHVIGLATMTKTGSLLGSPAHMAPEIIDGVRVDERADIFALGTVLYWMIAGQLPFGGDNAPQVLRNVMEGRYEPPEVAEPKISHDLSRIICKSLNNEPERRFSSADTVKRELLAAVHALGYDESDAMVREYFSDPADFAERFEADIVPRLISRGKRAVERRNVSAAIAYFNRVLAYDPQNEEVEECLDELDRSRRMTQVSAALAVLFVAGLGWLAFSFLGGDEPAPSAPDIEADRAVQEALARAEMSDAAAQSSEARVAVARAVADAQVTQIAAESAARRLEHVAEEIAGAKKEVAKPVASLEGPRPQINPPELVEQGENEEDEPSGEESEEEAEQQEPTTHSIAFRIYPPSATLRINGQEVEMWYKGVELPEGTHKLEATAPGCEPHRETLVVDGPREDKVPVVLDWKDARIDVISNKKALVFVGNDSNVHSRGVRSSVSVEFGREQPPSRTVRLRIADKENPRVVEERELTVRPGEEHTLNVNF